MHQMILSPRANPCASIGSYKQHQPHKPDISQIRQTVDHVLGLTPTPNFSRAQMPLLLCTLCPLFPHNAHSHHLHYKRCQSSRNRSAAAEDGVSLPKPAFSGLKSTACK